MELSVKGYRAAMVSGMYQAQILCPSCKNWVLTDNLEMTKESLGVNETGHEQFERVGHASGLNCQQTGCGNHIESLTLRNFPYSAPVKWRKAQPKSVQSSGEEKDVDNKS